MSDVSLVLNRRHENATPNGRRPDAPANEHNSFRDRDGLGDYALAQDTNSSRLVRVMQEEVGVSWKIERPRCVRVFGTS